MKNWQWKQIIRPLATVLVIVLLVSAASVATVFGYLKMSAEQSEASTFTADSNSNPTDSQSGVTNNAPYAVYMRAAVTVTWKDASGHVLGEMPQEGVDYTLTSDDDWAPNGAYYYHIAPVPASGTADTPVTLASQTPKEGYTLSCDILYQVIQALGSTDEGDVPAVTDAWSIAVDSNTGNLDIPTNQP